MVKNILTSLFTSFIVAIVAISIVITGVKKDTVQPSPSKLGSTIETVKVTFGAGAEIIPNRFDGGLIYKQSLATSTLATIETLPTSNIISYSTIMLTPNTPNLNLYLPASTTFPQSFLPRAGDRTEIVLFNASSTTGLASNMGLVSGSGTLITVASTTATSAIAATASTTGQNLMRISIIRKPNTDLLFTVSTFK